MLPHPEGRISQSKQHRSAELRMIPIGSIEVLNTRERNHCVFHEIVGNIRDIGLKKPISSSRST